MFQCSVFGETTLADCKRCPKYDSRACQIEVTADGIGDHLLGLSVVMAWKRDNPGKELHYAVKPWLRGWVELFGGYDRLVEPGGTLPHAWRAGNNDFYHFVDACAACPGQAMPPVKELPAEAVEWAGQYRGAVALAPWTLHSGREWPIERWLELVRRLQERGVRCVIIGQGDAAHEASAGQFPCEAVLGQSPPRVAALLRASVCLVGNESGMAHLAGALGVPAVVLSWNRDGHRVHAAWKKSHVIQNHPHRIEVEEVFRAVEPHIPWGGSGAPSPLARAFWHVARLVVARPAPWPGGPSTADRRATVRQFLNLLSAVPSALVVETGCQRADDDYGAGMSSTIFGLYLKGLGGRLVSLDNDPAHVAFCRERVRGLPVEVVLTDSRPWLRDYAGPPIDGLYLDSLDTTESGFSACCLEEVQAALPHLAPGAAVLIDDTYEVGGVWHGKGALAVPWLLEHGWRLLASGYQALLARP